MAMAKNEPVKIVLTGGHAATTAVAVVEELIRREQKPSWQIYWIGAKGAFEGKDIPTLESEIFPKLSVTFHPIVAGRIQRRFSLYTIPSLVKIPFGFIHAFYLLNKLKPKVVLSFGGFAAFPVVVAARVLGIPIIVHEQTTVAGRANRASGIFAKRIALAREESRKYFPGKKCILTGNPVLTQIAEISPKIKLGFPPVVFITGGSRGSQRVNDLIDGCLEGLLNKYFLIHQTGHMDFAKFIDRKNSLPDKLAGNYEVYDRIDPMNIDNIYREADMVIARAGANTVSEIIVARRPSILIPIPWTYLDEQTKNADYAAKFGIAKICKEGGLTSEKLFKAVEELKQNWQKIILSTQGKQSPDLHASSKLVDLVEETIE